MAPLTSTDFQELETDVLIIGGGGTGLAQPFPQRRQGRR